MGPRTSDVKVVTSLQLSDGVRTSVSLVDLRVVLVSDTISLVLDRRSGRSGLSLDDHSGGIDPTSETCVAETTPRPVVTGRPVVTPRVGVTRLRASSLRVGVWSIRGHGLFRVSFSLPGALVSSVIRSQGEVIKPGGRLKFRESVSLG